jgi:hypothetical protein
LGAEEIGTELDRTKLPHNALAMRSKTVVFDTNPHLNDSDENVQQSLICMESAPGGRMAI